MYLLEKEFEQCADNLLKGTAEIWTGDCRKLHRNGRKVPLGPWQTDGKNLVWFGEIKRKLGKLSKTTFTYRSAS
jgi:hypothetical protein